MTSSNRLSLAGVLAAAVILFSLTIQRASAAEPVRLTSNGRLKRDPQFINDGKQLIYVEQENPILLRLMRMNLSDRGIEPLHKDAGTSELEPDFSTDGRFYAFVQGRGNLSLALVIKDLREKTDAEVPPQGGFSGLRNPAISPDNKRVLYCYPEAGRQHIFSVNMQAQDRQQLTDSSGINNWPDFSPDGKKIVFGSTRDGNYDLYIMNADGNNVRRLTDHPTQDIRPEFSPDGTRIVFTSNRDRNYEIYVINTDGTNLKRITQHAERDDYATWHPDGKRLVIISERAGRFDLYLVNVPE